jgi:imidazolonepropionase-like amidohydrolase
MDTLVVRAGRAFDGERVLPGGAAVIVHSGRIAGVEPVGTALPDGAVVVDFPDGTVLPGLVDMHVHLGGDGRDGALDRLPDLSAAELDAVIDTALRRHLAAGVTTVRDLGDRRWSVLAWRDRSGDRGGAGPYPTILAAGPPVTSVRGHCWAMGGEVAGPDRIRAAVRERADRGVDIVKLMASGGQMTAGTDVLATQFSLDEVRLVVDEAHAAGLPVTAHAHGLPAVRQVVEAGVDGVEHCTCLTPAGIQAPDALLDSLRTKGIAVCPTLGRVPGVPLGPRLLAMMARTGMTFEARLATVGRMHAAGVRLVSGTDAGIGAAKPHGILADAIGDLVAGGVPATDALASATAAAARACGLGDRKGRLRTGYDADLLVVDGDPTADIAALHRVAAVVVGGLRV